MSPLIILRTGCASGPHAGRQQTRRGKAPDTQSGAFVVSGALGLLGLLMRETPKLRADPVQFLGPGRQVQGLRPPAQ